MTTTTAYRLELYSSTGRPHDASSLWGAVYSSREDAADAADTAGYGGSNPNQYAQVFEADEEDIVWAKQHQRCYMK